MKNETNEAELLLKIEKVAREEVIDLIMETLSAADLEALNDELLRGADEQAVMVFLHAHIPDLEERVQVRIVELKEEILGEAKELAAAQPEKPLSKNTAKKRAVKK